MASPPFGEHAKIEVLDDGRAVVYTGTSPHGQGHVTVVEHARPRADRHPDGQDRPRLGRHRSRPDGLRHDGLAVAAAGRRGRVDSAGELVENARKLAAKLLEADEADVVLDKDSGAFHVTGTPAVGKTWAELAVAAKTDGDFEKGSQAPRSSRRRARRSRSARTSPSSRSTPRPARSATSATSPATTPARVLNPMLLEGQIHGGVAQGTAQALLEEVRYDSDGNPITSNLADYAFISAAELPSIEVVHMETPTFVNPLGAKGIGESGTIGSTPAVQSAVIDAVSHLGVRHIDMPCTAERVWNAIEARAPDGLAKMSNIGWTTSDSIVDTVIHDRSTSTPTARMPRKNSASSPPIPARRCWPKRPRPTCSAAFRWHG